ncbi:MAG: helix-turn-helix transcriptional regulator [Oscillospiraceae bacterium]|nr:helix-turn-helix transcriptional regulator [Oscillospiraceae bacterium]
MENKTTFRKNLVRRRKELGLTQEQLAHRMNVSPQAVSKWENTSYPDPELLPQLARVLGTSIDALFGVKQPDAAVDLPQLIHNAIHSAKPEKRSQIIMELCYAIICAYDPNGDEAGRLRENFERETFAGIKTDHEVMMSRLNPDLRYFFFVEKPEDGVNHYFTNTKNMARFLRTLADEDAIRIISYLGSGRRNKMHSVPVIASRLNLPLDKTQYIIDRLDRFGIVWRVLVDAEEGESIMYGFNHTPPMVMILTLAESMCNYLQYWDPLWEEFTVGMFRDETGHNTNSIPQVSWWGEDEK